ncbi:hypothetical protein H4J58_13145 [Colwellia sp. MB3u-70]|uniref:hypothetical protein n=1 Tax=unclassified Colwellia TaxID=196834 RepID=UPI0015F4B55B|nr:MULTISPECIES: hypothetical protein [unclassified Colwellia]MBA6292857.1 hypothetical protein [Colwellia sp. MB3u-8]MBA6308059.1 hypothetical protein [Colwellia sp. MB3u-70]
MSLLLNAIEERQLLGINPQDENNIRDYLDYALTPHEKGQSEDVQTVVVPALWLTSSQHKRQLEPLFQQYALLAVIDVGTIWSPITAISFSLLVLGTEQVNDVLMAEFSTGATAKTLKPVDSKLTPKADKSGQLPDIVYSDIFKQFLTHIESELFGEYSNNQQAQQFKTFKVPAKELDTTRLQVSFYHPDNQIDISRYKKAKFEALASLAEVKNINPVKGGELAQNKVFKWSLLPSSGVIPKQLPIIDGDATNQVLVEGDIIITPNGSKVYLVNAELAGVFAPAHNYLIRLNANPKLSAQYLCLYLQSECAKKYSLKMAVGSVMPRLNIKDFRQLPILLPDDDILAKSDELYQQLQAPETDIDKINRLMLGIKDKGRLQDSFLLEELDKLRISKRAIIEKLIKDDLKELKVCIDKGLYKSSMVICGSILEAIILDWLSETEKHDYYRDDAEMTLSKGITLLKKLGELDYETVNAAHNIRVMRNLIHPRNYFQNQGKVTRRECIKLLEQLKQVIEAYKC